MEPPPPQIGVGGPSPTHAVVDEVRDVAVVGGIHGVDVLHVVQVEEVRGSLPVVHLPAALRLLRGDDL